MEDSGEEEVEDLEDAEGIEEEEAEIEEAEEGLVVDKPSLVLWRTLLLYFRLENINVCECFSCL